ncbi:MAG TPA: ComEC/Rec2 family competence protein, partial [Roseococcus sp.]|nr:ComEC/Rec2 family competence protein [Roseococcus sp.]
MREWLARLLEAEQGRLALWLPVAMGCGVLAFLLPRADPPAWLAWVALVPFLPAAWLARRHLLGGWLAGLCAAFGLGFALAAWHVANALPLPDLPRGAVVITGTVIELDPLPQGARVTLAGARWTEGMAPMRRSLRVRLQPRDAARPEPGDVIAVRALIRAPSPPAYPGAWDFQRAAFFEGQGGSGFALAPLEVMRRDGVAPPLAGMRAAIELRVMAALPGPAGAIAAAVLTGGQSGIPPAELQAMRDSGLAHLLSVSGLHIAIVLGLAFWLVRAGLALWPGFALRFGTKPWAALTGLAAGGFYMVLTGSQVPMQRSFVMAALVTVALLAGRRAISPRLLGFAAVAVMAMQPAAILGPSFQMSFAAVLALIAGFEAARPWLSGGAGPRPWWQRGLLVVAASLLTSLLAGAATTP